MISFRLLLAFVLIIVCTHAIANQSISDEPVIVDKPISSAMKDQAELPSLSKLTFVLVLCFIIVFFGIAAMKKYFYKKEIFPERSSVIELVSSKRISTKLTMHLIDVENCRYIIAEREGSIAISPHKPEGQKLPT